MPYRTVITRYCTACTFSEKTDLGINLFYRPTGTAPDDLDWPGWSKVNGADICPAHEVHLIGPGLGRAVVTVGNGHGRGARHAANSRRRDRGLQDSCGSSLTRRFGFRVPLVRGMWEDTRVQTQRIDGCRPRNGRFCTYCHRRDPYTDRPRARRAMSPWRSANSRRSSVQDGSSRNAIIYARRLPATVSRPPQFDRVLRVSVVSSSA